MSRNRKTQEEFTKEVYNLVGNEYKVLGMYELALKPVLMLHKKCNKTFDMRPNHFLRGVRCPHCSSKNNLKFSTEEYKKKIRELTNEEYELLDEYAGYMHKNKILHKKCNRIFEMTPDSFLRGSRCLPCFKSIKKDTDMFKAELNILVGNEYSVIGDYINTKTKILIKHNTCGNEYMVRPQSFLQGARCPKCRYKRRKNKNV
ncbi:hypothetical protein [Bacillus thuringiensis]|uniref:hypothetical protein n=1 Tax=Bacillus thuringiensis TaxID=1428 RepID=UPI003F5B0E03